MSSGKSNTDIQRVLQAINSQTQSNFIQHHVKAHQDKVKKWKDMSYVEKLNFQCDKMAKEAMDNHLDEPMYPTQETAGTPTVYQLPLEAACVLVDRVKQTTDVAKDLKRVISK